MHYFQFNWKDYIADTHSMSFVQHGAYIKLMGEFYRSEVELPLDIEEINDLVAPRTEEEAEAVKYILRRFFTKTETGYVQKRALVEIQAFKAKAEGRSKASMARWNKQVAEVVESDANAMQLQCKRNANQEPITKNKKYIPQIPAELLEQWMVVRKAKRLGAVTEVAFKAIEREAKAAGITTQQAVTICIERGWGSFKSDWEWKSTATTPVSQNPANRRTI